MVDTILTCRTAIAVQHTLPEIKTRFVGVWRSASQVNAVGFVKEFFVWRRGSWRSATTAGRRQGRVEIREAVGTVIEPRGIYRYPKSSGYVHSLIRYARRRVVVSTRPTAKILVLRGATAASDVTGRPKVKTILIWLTRQLTGLWVAWIAGVRSGRGAWGGFGEKVCIVLPNEKPLIVDWVCR